MRSSKFWFVTGKQRASPALRTQSWSRMRGRDFSSEPLAFSFIFVASVQIVISSHPDLPEQSDSKGDAAFV
jgi:hypothetical protein